MLPRGEFFYRSYAMTEFIGYALIEMIQPFNIFLMIIGLTGGIVVGALPGLTATMGVALMVPVTFAMDPASGLIMLGAIYIGGIYGGANSAILICTPGTPSSVVTTFDGWPMCQNGNADDALHVSLISSAFGTIVGAFFPVVFLRFLCPFRFAVRGTGKFLALPFRFVDHCGHEYR